jgi:hypothetical protein
VNVSRHKILFSSTMNETSIQKFPLITIRQHSLCDTKFEFIKLKSPRTKNQLIVKLEHAPLFYIPVVLKNRYCVHNFYNVLNADPVQNTFSFFHSLFLSFCRSVFSSTYTLRVYRVIVFFCLHSMTHTSQSVGMLWTSDRPLTETSSWQYTTFTRGTHPCL